MATYVSKFTGAQIDQRLEMAEQVPNKADKSELPSKVSDLVNDSGFISETQKITGGGASKTVPEMLVQTVENTTAIATEKNRAEEAEGVLGTAINNERTRAQGAEQDNANAIAAEKSRAEGAEAAMNEKISALEASKYKVVEVLPETGETNVIYLVPSPRPSQKNIKDEFIWVDGAWEQIGSTEIDLSDYAHKGEVRHIERDLGMYPELEPVPLNSEVTGKYINSDGKYVDASDWNIASIGAVSLGNTYLLNMVSSANMVLGVALFVSRVYKRDKEGKIIGTTLTPLFSAKNTSIPASGYVLFEAMDDYEEVLICYKPALTTQMLVARWGFKASHATQLRNLRLIVDNKTDFEGIYELLTAGYALNLVGKGNGEPQAFMSRKTGGGNITDGSAVIKEVDGVQPIVWNQVNNIPFALGYWKTNRGAMSMDEGLLCLTFDGDYEQGYNQGINTNFRANIAGHIYAIAYKVKSSYDCRFGGDFANAAYGYNFPIIPANTWGESVVVVTAQTSGGSIFLCSRMNVITGQKVWFKDLSVVDLTQMFGAGNEPSTYEEYLDRISHYHIKDTYAHNAGEVMNYKGTGIKTTGRNIWDEEWEVGSLDGITGQPQEGVMTFRSKNYCPIFGGTEYYIVSASFFINIFYYDKDKNFIVGKTFYGGNVVFTTPGNAAYFKVRTDSPNNIYNHDICINLSDPAFNGQYEPYRSYVRDWSEVMKKYFPDGMTSLNGVKDFFNERKAARKFGVVDLGTLDWIRLEGGDHYFFSTSAISDKADSTINMICAIYKNGGTTYYSNTKEDKTLYASLSDGEAKKVYIRDDAYTTAESFKAAMAGVLLFYELAEPVEDIFEKPLNLTYTVINGGTETSLATENSTQFEGSIAYNKDYVAVVDELQMQNRVTTIEFENWEN